MDFRDSPKEAEFRAEARAFLEAHAPEQPVDFFDDEADEEELLEKSLDWQKILFEHGWAAMTWSREYGGRGVGPIEQIIWNQELGRAGFGETMFVVGIGMAGPTEATSRRSASSRPCCAATRSGASSSASPEPARISPAWHAGRSETATGGW